MVYDRTLNVQKKSNKIKRGENVGGICFQLALLVRKVRAGRDESGEREKAKLFFSLLNMVIVCFSPAPVPTLPKQEVKRNSIPPFLFRVYSQTPHNALSVPYGAAKCGDLPRSHHSEGKS